MTHQSEPSLPPAPPPGGPEREPASSAPADSAASSLSGRLEALLHELPSSHRWESIEDRVLASIERVPQVEETSISGWLYWLFFATMLGTVAMGLVRFLPSGGKFAVERFLPSVGCSVMIVSALGLVWASLKGARPRPDHEASEPSARWLMVISGLTAAIAGTIIALIPWTRRFSLPPWLIPFLILLAASGLVAGLAQETSRQSDTLALPPDAGIRRLMLVAGLITASVGAALQVWFNFFWLPH